MSDDDRVYPVKQPWRRRKFPTKEEAVKAVQVKIERIGDEILNVPVQAMNAAFKPVPGDTYFVDSPMMKPNPLYESWVSEVDYKAVEERCAAYQFYVDFANCSDTTVLTKALALSAKYGTEDHYRKVIRPKLEAMVARRYIGGDIKTCERLLEILGIKPKVDPTKAMAQRNVAVGLSALRSGVAIGDASLQAMITGRFHPNANVCAAMRLSRSWEHLPCVTTGAKLPDNQHHGIPARALRFSTP